MNERMETSVPNVYACGDCAEFNGANYAVWPEASEQGRIAGANAAGDQIEYAATAPTLTFHGMNTEITGKIRICFIRRQNLKIWEKEDTVNITF